MTTTTLTAADRCDRCGAQAYVQMERGTVTLLFCVHHHREHQTALTAQGWSLSVDNREAVTTS